MKATGIVRRIDDLGRIVIPKEIRRTMHIRESDPLEIFTGNEGEVILKKYSPIEEMGELAQGYADALTRVIGYLVCVSDMDRMIAAGGKGKKMVQGRRLSAYMEKTLAARKNILAGEKDSTFVEPFQESVEQIGIAIRGEIVCPIISQGDIIGGIMIFQQEGDKTIGEAEQNYAQVGANFLGQEESR